MTERVRYSRKATEDVSYTSPPLQPESSDEEEDEMRRTNRKKGGKGKGVGALDSPA